MNTKACLVLANGQIFEGKSFGASGVIVGEAVFTTGTFIVFHLIRRERMIIFD